MKKVTTYFNDNRVTILAVGGRFLFDPNEISVCVGISEDKSKEIIDAMDTACIVKSCPVMSRRLLTERGVYKYFGQISGKIAVSFLSWLTQDILPYLQTQGLHITIEDIPHTEYIDDLIRDYK